MMQETDQNYGYFKTQFVKNLKEVLDARIMGESTTSLPPLFVGLIAFGGNDPVSNVICTAHLKFACLNDNIVI